jgi:hypothetical protein
MTSTTLPAASSFGTKTIIIDTTAPVITVTSGTDTVEQGSTWTDAGATADGGETVTASGTVDTSTIGSYIITYNATDASDNVGTATRTVTVIDTTAPTFVLVAAADGTYKVGDNIDITVTYDEDVSVTGTPTLTLSNGATATYQSGSGTTALVFRYTVAEGDTNSSDLSVSSYTGVITDGSGNTAGAASGYLGAVIVDANSPVITVTSGTDTVSTGSSWTDAGATADGGETVTASGTVDTSTIGSYIITYNATDASGNVGTATRTVTVGVVGDSYQGGIIFWLDGNGGGLISAPTDQSSAAQWGCYGTNITGAGGTAIGTGNQNTIDIINANCTSNNVPNSATGAGSPTAADICANLTLGGYSDWFLPSKGELNKMYLNKAAIGGFANDYYWSSTESGTHGAWDQNFSSGGPDTSSKQGNDRVRAIRAF